GLAPDPSRYRPASCCGAAAATAARTVCAAAQARRGDHGRARARDRGARSDLMRLLLDVNVWVALFDDAHVFSEQANELIESPGLRIAPCPLVENGVIRVMNSPSYGRRGAVGIRQVRIRLQQA